MVLVGFVCLNVRGGRFVLLDVFCGNSCELSRYQRRGVGGRDWKPSQHVFPKAGVMWGAFSEHPCALRRGEGSQGLQSLMVWNMQHHDLETFQTNLATCSCSSGLSPNSDLPNTDRNLLVFGYLVSGCCKVSATAAGTAVCWGTWGTADHFVAGSKGLIAHWCNRLNDGAFCLSMSVSPSWSRNCGCYFPLSTT